MLKNKNSFEIINLFFIVRLKTFQTTLVEIKIIIFLIVFHCQYYYHPDLNSAVFLLALCFSCMCQALKSTTHVKKYSKLIYFTITAYKKIIRIHNLTALTCFIQNIFNSTNNYLPVSTIKFLSLTIVNCRLKYKHTGNT